MLSEKIRILSRSFESFRDRIEAGEFLVNELKEYKNKDIVVVGIPRGGVVIAASIAKNLQCDFDIVIVRKIGYPSNPEFAIGAISEDGSVFINRDLSFELDGQKTYIENETKKQLDIVKERVEIFRKIRPKVGLKDKIVIVTDDGIATGSTMQSALWMIRKELPKKIVVAIPVASNESLVRIKDDADEIICLRMPEFFAAVGQFYRNFNQVEDNDVANLLREAI
ncbi:MAG: phosphoribosyltransferase family protein [Candidatus Omnitrophota bacterium]